VSSSPERVANLLGACALAVGDRLRDATLLDPRSAHDAAALVSIANYPGQTVNELASALGLSQPGTVRLLDRLEASGLVERQRGGGDRRALALELTAAGRRTASAALARRAEALGSVLATLDASEAAALEPLLERVLAGLTGSDSELRVICRLCDEEACERGGRCPVALAATGRTSRRA
jgi:DNA-binding MarR family transcriptional regulator